jgi:hypothetical protein
MRAADVVAIGSQVAQDGQVLRLATVVDLPQSNQPRPDCSTRTLMVLCEVGDVPSGVESLHQLSVLARFPGLAGAIWKVTFTTGAVAPVGGSSFERFDGGKQRPNTLRVLKRATIVQHLSRKRIHAVGESAKDIGGSFSFHHTSDLVYRYEC